MEGEVAGGAGAGGDGVGFGGDAEIDVKDWYGLAVTGLVDVNRMLRNSTGRPGLPLSLTKKLGTGVLNSRHKATGERFDEAIAAMTTSNRAPAHAAVERGVTCATDITGFGLLGHVLKLARASGVTAVIDSAAVEYLDGARQAAADGYISGGTRRNLVCHHAAKPDAAVAAASTSVTRT